MIYSATVIKAGDVQGTWIVSPAYTRNDGQPAPNILALSADSIVPVAGDIVLCAEGINPFDHSSVRSFDNNGGSNPVIIATYAQILETLCDMIIRGKVTLGAGTKKMVLGDTIQTQLQKIVDQLTQLKTDFSTWVVVPMDGGAALKAKIAAGFALKPSADLSQILSSNHKLD